MLSTGIISKSCSSAKYKFEIVEVYPGTKWKDVAISEICSYGCCFSASTFIKTDGIPMAASDLKVGSEITTIDLTNNSCNSSQILRTQSTHHNQMIRITAGQSTIELTSYHPLFFDGYGYTSLYEIKKTNFFNNYEEMTGTLKVLKWNNETNTSEYCTITNIEVLTGNFLTYSIEDLSQGEVTVAGPTLSKALMPTDKTGIYKVQYRAVAADGHVIKGEFSFSVEASAVTTSEIKSEPLTTSPSPSGNKLSIYLILSVTAIVGGSLILIFIWKKQPK